MSAEQGTRITVPIFHIVFDDAVAGRIQLGKNVILGQLNAQESKRVQAYHAIVAGYTDDFHIATKLRPPSHRVEIFADADQDMDAVQIGVHDKMLDVMSLLALASRAAPVWYSEPVDRWNSGEKTWERAVVIYNSGGAGPSYNRVDGEINSYLPTTGGPAWRVSADAVEAWGRLLQLWRDLPGKSPLRIAARYFHDAIMTLRGNSWRSFISASICLECIFGDSSTELSYRISQRAANLGRVADLDADATYQFVRKSYNARSKLVHEGTHPDPRSVVDLLELLRKLLPIMGILDSESGSHKNALARIDSAGIGNNQVVADLKERSNVWVMPDITGGPIHSRKAHQSFVRDLFPELFADIEELDDATFRERIRRAVEDQS
jgi:hypothetical protein